MAGLNPGLGLCFFLLVFGSIRSSAASRMYSSSLALVPEPKIDLIYHGGPLLSGPGTLDVYLIWYGAFGQSQKAILKDFFSSFGSKQAPPSVSSWWSVASLYKDSSGKSVFTNVRIAKEIQDNYSLGKNLGRNSTRELTLHAIDSGIFPRNSKAFYLILTSSDVEVHGFCVQTCGYHRHTEEMSTHPANLAYGWVGNSMSRCPGKCAWPFAHPRDYFGPDKEPLVAPNDVGVDGMIINLAMVLAGTATNPFGNGYYQGHELSHLGAASACTGIFGKGAFSGHPGELKTDSRSGASFNAFGSNGRKFLLPAVWDPRTASCVYPA